MDSAQPPIPPQIAAQQGPPPIRQFAQGAGGAQAGGDQSQNSDQLASSLLDQIGKQMTQLAQIIVQTKPELVPILKQSIQALSMVAGKIKTGPQGGGAPQGGSQGTAGDTAPDAGGGASLGMPQ